MLVSRPHINTEELVRFPAQDRFLKLPISGFLKIDKIEPIAPQIAMINALEDPRHRYIVACLSRRTGKTYISNVVGFVKALEPNSKVLIVSPSFSLTDISWEAQTSLLKQHNIEIITKNKQKAELWLSNGSLIKFGSVANADSLVGRSYDLIIFDEAAIDWKGGNAFNIQLLPTLDKPNSKCIFISTPRGSNYFHEFYKKGFEECSPEWVSIHSTYKDNPRTDMRVIEDAKRTMSKAEFKQEYEADFTTFEGQIYEAFDADKHSRDLTQEDFYTNKYRFDPIMSIDPGYRDATGAILIIYDLDEDHYYITWDYEFSERTTEQHASVFKEQIDKHDIYVVYCDPAAAQFRQDLNITHDIQSMEAKKSVLDGIAFVQSVIESGKLTVCTSCEATLNMLMNYRWDPNEKLQKARPVHDSFSHLADALRYAVYSYTT